MSRHKRSPRLAAGAACALALALAFAAPAAAGTIRPPAVFATQVAALAPKTSVPFLFPDRLPWSGPSPRLHAAGWTSGRGWVLSLAGAPRCGGATACLVASFAGRRGGALPGPSNLRLPGGQPALYRPIACGASCGPASLWFVHRGALYTWRLKEPPPGGARAVARLAATAIAAGPR